MAIVRSFVCSQQHRQNHVRAIETKRLGHGGKRVSLSVQYCVDEPSLSANHVGGDHRGIVVQRGRGLLERGHYLI